MDKPKIIKRTDALTDMELHELGNGKPNIFSIRFVSKEGESIYLPHAKAAGLKANMKKNRLRGVQPCTSEGSRIGHVYPVCIDNIIEFNSQIVKL